MVSADLKRVRLLQNIVDHVVRVGQPTQEVLVGRLDVRLQRAGLDPGEHAHDVLRPAALDRKIRDPGDLGDDRGKGLHAEEPELHQFHPARLVAHGDDEGGRVDRLVDGVCVPEEADGALQVAADGEVVLFDAFRLLLQQK